MGRAPVWTSLSVADGRPWGNGTRYGKRIRHLRAFRRGAVEGAGALPFPVDPPATGPAAVEAFDSSDEVPSTGRRISRRGYRPTSGWEGSRPSGTAPSHSRQLPVSPGFEMMDVANDGLVGLMGKNVGRATDHSG
ncbi:hypothetical protein GCM10017556_44620 [Micromonospora sagamiensis]|nr:hypothetical protein GCM10017556_44620 [Micromonospora sagamiensis]